MEEKKNIVSFDWQRLLFSEEHPIDFTLEILFRTIFMFLFLVVVLRYLTNRGVKQLSVFELAILIALGSATGDPMFYENVPLLHGVVVLVVVVAFYRFIVYATNRWEALEIFFEGKPLCVLENGTINWAELSKSGLPSDELYALLRQKSVEHLGQVRKVYQETSGETSIYLHPAADTVPGLPIFPELLENPLINIINTGSYACIMCGNIREMTVAGACKCSVCHKNKWLPVAGHKLKSTPDNNE